MKTKHISSKNELKTTSNVVNSSELNKYDIRHINEMIKKLELRELFLIKIIITCISIMLIAIIMLCVCIKVAFADDELTYKESVDPKVFTENILFVYDNNPLIKKSLEPMMAEREAKEKAKREERIRLTEESIKARKAFEEEQRKKEEEAAYIEYLASQQAQTTYYTQSGGALTKSKGVNYYNGRRETWYSQKVLPGGGLNILGRYVASDGTIRDGDGYICVAASDLAKGTIIDTSLGQGKVYDTGCASGTTDIYTNW